MGIEPTFLNHLLNRTNGLVCNTKKNCILMTQFSIEQNSNNFKRICASLFSQKAYVEGSAMNALNLWDFAAPSMVVLMFAMYLY